MFLCVSRRRARAGCSKCDPLRVLLQGTCYATCPPKYYADFVNTCQACDYSCETCEGPGVENCLTCDPATPLRAGGRCVASCPDGFAREPDVQGTPPSCGTCDASCGACNAPRSPSNCTACAAGSYLTLSGACLSSCPVGTLPDPSTAQSTCIACDDSCAACSISPSNCTACPSGFKLNAGACVQRTTAAIVAEEATSLIELGQLAQSAQAQASSGFDAGYGVASLELVIPTLHSAPNATASTFQKEVHVFRLDGEWSASSVSTVVWHLWLTSLRPCLLISACAFCHRTRMERFKLRREWHDPHLRCAAERHVYAEHQ